MAKKAYESYKYEELERIHKLINNIIDEIKLQYPFIRISQTKIMNYVDYDVTYLYPSKYKKLSGYIYKRLHSRLKNIDIDKLVGDLFYSKYNNRGEKKSK